VAEDRLVRETSRVAWCPVADLLVGRCGHPNRRRRMIEARGDRRTRVDLVCSEPFTGPLLLERDAGCLHGQSRHGRGRVGQVPPGMTASPQLAIDGPPRAWDSGIAPTNLPANAHDTVFFSASFVATANRLPPPRPAGSHQSHPPCQSARNHAGHHQNLSGVRTIPVSFTVVNDNATAVPCLPDNPDGKTYTVSGSLDPARGHDSRRRPPYTPTGSATRAGSGLHGRPRLQLRGHRGRGRATRRS